MAHCQMYRAVFLLATPLSLLTAGLSFVVIPAIMELQFDVLAKARKEAEVSMFAPGTFREVLNGRHVVYIGALDERELRNVFIQSREPDGSLSITTGAQGRQETSEEGIRSIVLDHGYRYRGAPGQGNYDMLRFERATVRVDTAPPPQDWRHRETLPTRQLLHSSDPIHIAELQMRINSPVQILVIALWAPLLARAQPREGRYGRIVAAVLIYAVNFNLVGVGESWLSHGVIGPSLGLWWVHGLFLLFGLGLLLHDYFDGRSIRLIFQRPDPDARRMKILDRYIFRTVATTTAVALLVLLLLELFLSLLAELEDVGKGRYDFMAAVRYLLLIQPQRLYEMFPMALLVGGLLGMGALASGSELIAMRAAGCP
jgi:lipopolysaccharide export system permease protein